MKQSEVLAKEFRETAAKLMQNMSAIKKDIDDVRKEKGDGTSAELKEEVNKMAKDFAQNVADSEKNQNAMIKRIDDLEKELQEEKEKNMKWNASAKLVNPYSDILGNMYKGVKDLDSYSNATDAQVIEAITGYGKKVPHKSDIRSLLFPERMKALLTSTATPGSGAAGALMTPEYQEMILPPAQERKTLLDEFPMVGTNFSKLIWREEKLSRRRGSAGVTVQSLDFTGANQGATGTEVEFEFESKEEEMRTFLGIAFASIQVLQDVGYMQAYVGNQLEYEANRTLSSNVLYGTNKVGNTADQARQLNSLNAASTEFDLTLLPDVVAGGTHYIDVLKTAWLQATLTFIDPTKHFMHPTDYTAMLLLKDNDGKYMFVPNINNPDMLSPLGMPVATSTYIQQDNFFTIPANECMICVKKGWESGMSYEDRTNFQELEVTFRVWGRYGFIMFRRSSQVKGTFSTAFAA